MQLLPKINEQRTLLFVKMYAVHSISGCQDVLLRHHCILRNITIEKSVLVFKLSNIYNKLYIHFPEANL